MATRKRTQATKTEKARKFATHPTILDSAHSLPEAVYPFLAERGLENAYLTHFELSVPRSQEDGDEDEWVYVCRQVIDPNTGKPVINPQTGRPLIECEWVKK